MITVEMEWIQLNYDEMRGFFEIIDKPSRTKIVSNAYISTTLKSSRNPPLFLTSYDDTSKKEHELKPIVDKNGKAKSLVAKYVYTNGFILTVSIIIYETKPLMLFQTSIWTSQNDYKLNSFHVFSLSKTTQGDLQLGEIKDWRVLRQDWQSWSPIEVISVKKRIKRPWMKLPKRIMYSTKENFKPGACLSDNFMVIKNISTQKFITLGFISMRDHITQIGLKADYNQNEIQELYAISLLGEIPLQKNTEIFSEKLILIFNGMNAVESLDYYAALVQQEMNARFWDPIPTGWCSWYYYYSTRVSEKAMLQNSEFLSLNRKQLPIELVQLDDGYYPKTKGNSRVGDWLETNKRFPHGLKWLVEEVKADGFKAGLWIAPFLISRSSKLFKEHPHWVIRDSNGNPMEVNINPEWGTFNKLYGLDCTHPDVQEWLRTLFRTIVKEWGFQFVKLDFIYAAAVDGVFHDPTMTRIQAYRKGMEIIRETVGENIFVLGCGAPLGPSIGIVNGMRIGPDTYYAFGQPFLYWFLNTFFFAGLGETPSMANALKTVMLRSFMHRKFWINDPDCLLVRRTRSALKSHEIEFEMTLMGLSGGILLSSDNLSELTPEDLEYIQFLLPVYGAHATPIDLFENNPPIYYKMELSIKSLPEPYSLIGIFNWTNKEKSVLLSVEQLELKHDVSYHIFDFWENRYFQLDSTHSQVKRLKKHTAKLLVIRPITKDPQLIASSFHISQGAVEITKFAFNSATNEITIELMKSGRNRGCLYLHLPASYHEKELISDAPHHSMYRLLDGPLVLQLQFEDKAHITLKLEKSLHLYNE